MRRTLARLCRVYGVGLSHFFADDKQYSLSITRKTHALDRGRGESAQKIPLHTRTNQTRMVAKIVDFPIGVTISANKGGSDIELISYVLSGSLQLNFAGTQETLETGDCAVLKTEGSVIVGASGESRCQALVVSSSKTIQS